MTGPAKPGAASAQPKSSAWQSLLVLPALGSLGFGVMLPLWVVAIVISTVLSGAWCTYYLEKIGIVRVESLMIPAAVSTVIILGGLGATAWVSVQETFHKAGAPQSKGIRGWLLRRPWWTLGLALALANVLSLSEPRGHGVAAATLVLAQCSWFILTATVLAWRLAWGGLRLGWRMSRASSFMAGLVVAAGFFTAAGWSVSFPRAGELAQPAGRDLQQLVHDWAQLTGASVSASHAESPAPPHAESPAPLHAESLPLPPAPALFERQKHGEVQFTSVRLGDPSGPDVLGGGDAAVQAQGVEAPDGFSDCVLKLNPQLKSEATAQARRYVDASEAEDVVQDVLLRICLRKIPPATFSPYFIRSVQNRAQEWSHRASRPCAIDEQPEPSCDLHPETEYLRQEQSRAVSKALCALPDEDQKVLRLRFFEGEDYVAIAQSQGWTPDNARQRVSRALKKLQAAYQEKCLK